MASKKRKHAEKQERIRQLKLRQRICSILFLVDTVLVLLLSLFSQDDMTGAWVLLLLVAAVFFLISNNTKRELAVLDPNSVSAPSASPKMKRR